MAEGKPMVTLDEAYWWLNEINAPVLRPPLQELLASITEADKNHDRQTVEKITQLFVDSQLNYLRSPIKENVEKLQNAVQIWIAEDFETACKKLSKSGGSYLRNPDYAYVLKMRKAVSQNPAEAWVPLDRLYIFCNSISDGREAGETLVECGYALYKLEHRTRAVQLFQEANQRYCSYTHQIAVVSWMIGYILWELGLQNEALIAWRQSTSRFEKLATMRITHTSADTKWYGEALIRLNASIEYAIEHENEMTPPAQPAAPEVPALLPAGPKHPAGKKGKKLTRSPRQSGN
jgi:tetratricopeptide (TPR) repeat protein